ncbi:MAG: bifunctional DNase/RNase [Flavobacteriales bacterium]|jgi:bifunctional DNase/RNase|tara:strand:- start:453 stop:1073 length:621 start_codon:yes stop_codon:yes gene_type:complete
MKKVQLEIAGLSYSHTQSGAYALVFNEADGTRRLPIIIGGTEAQAIAIELEGMTPSRPLTHDLFKSFAEEFQFTVEEIIIYNLIEGIFFSKLICKNKDGNSVEIDSRTSDAVAIAVRFNCPIFTYEFILSSAGIILEDQETEEGDEKEDILETESSNDLPIVIQDTPEESKMTIEELEEELNNAIENEEYEKASKLRDIINNKNSN